MKVATSVHKTVVRLFQGSGLNQIMVAKDIRRRFAF